MTHTSQRELNKKIKKTRKRIEVGKKYRHFKNSKDLYIIEQIGILENTEEVCCCL